MFSSRTYSPLRSSEDSETPVKIWLPWGSWLASRRIRNAIAIALMCLLGIAFLRSSLSPFYLDRYRASRHNATGNTLEPSDIVNFTNVHWLDFAYTQYVTNSNYLCNSVMMFEALDRLGRQTGSWCIHRNGRYRMPIAAAQAKKASFWGMLRIVTKSTLSQLSCKPPRARSPPSRTASPSC